MNFAQYGLANRLSPDPGAEIAHLEANPVRVARRATLADYVDIGSISLLVISILAVLVGAADWAIASLFHLPGWFLLALLAITAPPVFLASVYTVSAAWQAQFEDNEDMGGEIQD